MKQHGLPVAECPRCSCEFDPGVNYSILEVAHRLKVKRKTVMWWMAIGRMGYRVRPLNGFTHERIITSYHLMKFLDAYWPDPSFDPNGNSLAHRLWRRAQTRAHKASEAALTARRARHAQEEGSMDSDDVRLDRKSVV